MKHLQTLTDRTRPIDTGLKAAVLVALYDYGCATTSSVVDLFGDLNAYQNEEFNYSKKAEGVMNILRQFDEENLIILHDRGKVAPNNARYHIEEKEGEHIDATRQVAYDSITTCSLLDIPLHHFWQVRGGSYSTHLKQVTQGIHLATFYGLKPVDLEEKPQTQLEDEPIIRQDFGQKLDLQDRHASTYLKKFVDMDFVSKSHPLGKNNDFGAAPNACTYSLTPSSKLLMEKLFFPHLAKTFTKVRPTTYQHPTSEDITNIVQLHYEGFVNQYSK